jgi:hypothetical protein
MQKPNWLKHFEFEALITLIMEGVIWRKLSVTEEDIADTEDCICKISVFEPNMSFCCCGSY